MSARFKMSLVFLEGLAFRADMKRAVDRGSLRYQATPLSTHHKRTALLDYGRSN